MSCTQYDDYMYTVYDVRCAVVVLCTRTAVLPFFDPLFYDIVLVLCTLYIVLCTMYICTCTQYTVGLQVQVGLPVALAGNNFGRGPRGRLHSQTHTYIRVPVQVYL